MLLSILRTTDSFSEKAPIPLSSALFSQILIGGYDITVGLNGPADVGLARLEDAELERSFSASYAWHEYWLTWKELVVAI